jgi:predicted permease
MEAMGGAQAGLLNSLLAAIQASLSVLLVISYGIVAAKLGLLDTKATKSISKICVKIFLPALLLTKIGSELHSGSAHRYLVILAWAFICHFVSFLIGLSAHLLFGMPDWITAAIMFNNTTSYPLLLIQSLDETGILSSLITNDETTHDAIERAKSYFLVFATVSSCLTFAVGPRLIDSEHAPDEVDDKDDVGEEDCFDRNGDSSHAQGDGYEEDGGVSPTDATPLFSPRRPSLAPVSFYPTQPREGFLAPAHISDRRPSAILITKRRWLTLSDRTKWWLLFLYDFLNAPLIGAVLGAIIGMVPALHRAFFNDTQDGGIFTAWLTASWKNVGGLFVPLPVVVAGVSLYTSMKETSTRNASPSQSNPGHGHFHESTPWLTTSFVLFVRFVVWPAMSIAVIYWLRNGTDVLGTDPMLWFTLMLMPTGPPAMKLITMVEVSDCGEEEEHKIAKLLTVSFLVALLFRLSWIFTSPAYFALCGWS